MEKLFVDRDRMKAAAGVAAIHAAIGYALIAGLGSEATRAVEERLRAFDVIEVPPPAEEPLPAEPRADAPEGAASPPALRARPTPVVAPPPEIRLDVPPPIIAAPEATPLPPGFDPAAGNADLAGPGTGSGGEGAGTGSGGRGSGSGSGLGRRAERTAGALTDSDYPVRGPRPGVETVSVRFTVRVDGRAADCSVTRSSGNAALDSATCRLIERRFRYRPARDPAGRPAAQTIETTFDWVPPGLARL